MKSLCQVFVIALFLVSALSVYSQNATFTVKYNWAKSGLNIREASDLESRIIGVIPFGDSVLVSSEKEREFSLEIVDVFSNEKSVDNSGFYLNGNWAKIKHGNADGYVFDGYLSDLAPLRFVESTDGYPYPEEFENYLDRVYDLNQRRVVQKVGSDAYQKRSTYHQGVIYEHNGSVGWYEHVFILPDARIKDGLLLFLLLKDTEEIKRIHDSEKFQILRFHSDKFEATGLGEDFEFYQFGNVLVIKISGSC